MGRTLLFFHPSFSRQANRRRPHRSNKFFSSARLCISTIKEHATPTTTTTIEPVRMIRFRSRFVTAKKKFFKEGRVPPKGSRYIKHFLRNAKWCVSRRPSVKSHQWHRDSMMADYNHSQLYHWDNGSGGVCNVADSTNSKKSSSHPIVLETKNLGIAKYDNLTQDIAASAMSAQYPPISRPENTFDQCLRLSPVSSSVGTLSLYELPTQSLRTTTSGNRLDLVVRQRRGTAAAFLPSVGALLSFGGCAKLGGSRWLQSDLRIVSFTETPGRRPSVIGTPKIGLGTWSHIPFASSLPTPVRRHRHSLTTLSDNQVLLFGGTTGITHFNDVWLLQGSPIHWSRILPSDSTRGLSRTNRPAPRSNHRAVAWEVSADLLERLKEMSLSRSDLDVFMETPSDAGSPEMLTSMERQFKTSHWENGKRVKCFVTFGGTTQMGQRCRDCWILDVDQPRWYELPMTGLPESSKDPIIGVWRNDLYICGSFGRETKTNSPPESDTTSSNICRKTGTNVEESISIYKFDVDALQWSLWHRGDQQSYWCPMHDVIVGCTWLQCMPSTVHANFQQLPLFHLFDFVLQTWTQLDLSASPHIGISALNESPNARGLRKYCEPGNFQLVSFPESNSRDAVVILHGLSHPIRLQHPEITRSVKWERRRFLLWLYWLAHTGLWQSATEENQQWKKVFTEMPEDIVRSTLEFL